MRHSTRLRVGAVFRWNGALCYFLALQAVVVPGVALGQSIVPDGRTQTGVSTRGTVTDVTTATVRGTNAFNSFSRFGVDAGTTANLHVPSGAANLINLVRDARTDVNGVLNSIRDGRIGGNVWFANPHGFVVGAGGVVNVGSLSVSTPTQAFVDGFFVSPGNPDEAAVGQLLSGTAPRSGTGLISILGRINAAEGVELSAGAINVGGTVYSGARFVGTAPDFTDVVNANGLVAATNVVVKEGRIRIVADGDVAVSGTVAAPGAPGIRGGEISVRAGRDVALESGARIVARGGGERSSGGVVNVWAERDAVARAGAVVDASAGTSGDGGAIEFSARRSIELAGGEFRAGAAAGRRGTVLVDPATVTVSANYYSGGADHTIQADESITVNPGVVVSTRNVTGGGGADQETAASAGNSGDLTLSAPTIELQSGSKLFAHADGPFVGGTITLAAESSGNELTLAGIETRVSMSHAMLRGRDVVVRAQSTYTTALLPVVVKSVMATIDVDSSVIHADGGLARMEATATADAATPGIAPLGTIAIDAVAGVDVHGSSQVKASGDARMTATSTVTAKALPGLPDFVNLPGDAGVAVNVIGSQATVHVGGTTTLEAGGTVALGAVNSVSAEAKADASATGASAVGGTLALSVINTTTRASLDGAAQVTGSGALELKAASVNTVETGSKAAGGGATQKGTGQSRTEQTLSDYQDEASTADGGVTVAAAVAVAELTSTTQAFLGSTGQVNSSGAVAVSSEALNQSTTTADASSTGGSVGVGAAVALNIGVTSNMATVADNSRVNANGVTVSAVSPVNEKNSFAAEAKSGAGASNVGVAGALAVNTLVNTTIARLEGDRDGSGLGADVNAGTGDVLIEAGNASTSTVKSGADVAGTGDSAKVGVGASVGFNVAVNTTVAEIGDKARLAGGHDLSLKAAGDHTLSTEVTGGAASAGVSVTPVVAATIAVNTTTARLGESATDLGLTGRFDMSAAQTSGATTQATGQTEGGNVAVGASVALNVATDTVLAAVERNIAADDGVSVTAASTAKSSAEAVASVKGGEKADDNGNPPSPGGGGAGESVDQKVLRQRETAKATGKKTVAKDTSGSGTDPSGKLDDTKAAPKSEDSTQAGGVSVAAAAGVNVGVATTTASIGEGRKVSSTAGALTVGVTHETDASAKADGSQVDSGSTNVGVGAAVALNLGVSTNVATVGDNADIDTQGVTVKAVNAAGQKSDFGADAKSGAGAGNVGVAGSLAANVVVNTTVAKLEGDKDGSGLGADVNAGSGDVLIEAGNASTSTVKSGADVTGTGGSAKVGVGASVGVNVAVNTTVAEIEDDAKLAGGHALTLKATADHTLSTEVTGGAAGAQVAVTPVGAVTIGVNTTTARLGESATDLALTGQFDMSAAQTSSASTRATGQTEGGSVAVGASVAVTIATDTVVAAVERNTAANDGVSVTASSRAKSSAEATASVAGGEKADEATDKPASGDAGTVDSQVTAQGDAAKKSGAAADAGAGSKLSSTRSAPKAEVSGEGSGGSKSVSVAAAVGANVGVATTTASIGKGRKVSSSGGALTVASTNETDASARADGSQVDSGNTNVGVGAAVALNVGVSTNVATVGDNADIDTQGVTVKATNAAGEKSDFGADAKSGAGAGNVGVAGALAANIVVNTSVATFEGDKDGSGTGADVNAGTGDVLIEAGNASTSAVKAGADVKGSGDSAKVGVGAAVGLNVVVNTAVAEIEDDAKLAGGHDLTLKATADHTLSTEVTGGSAGAKVAVTPVAAVTIGVNTTSARVGEAATALALSGALSVQSEHADTVTTKATGQAQGDVAVGASLAATIAVDNAFAKLDRDVDSATGVELDASSKASLRTESTAGAKGAKAPKLDANGNEEPETGSSVDEQKKNQLDFAKSRNDQTTGLDTTTPAAETPAVNKNDTPTVDKNAPPPGKNNAGAGKQQGKKVSVAAAIGVGVAWNQAAAVVGEGRSISTTGNLDIKAATDTNYTTMATGAAVSDDIGVAAAVALTATRNVTQATLGRNAHVSEAAAINISAAAEQNRDNDFLTTMSAEAVSGAGGGQVAVAGALAVVLNDNQTRASIDEGATIGTNVAPVGAIAVNAEDTSKIAAQARAGSLSIGKDSKAGIGASFAVLLSNNQTTAAVGYDADPASGPATTVHADSITVTAAKNRIEFNSPLNIVDVENFSFDQLDPSSYLGSNNYYTEAIAGAAAKGAVAVAGAFSVNLFRNVTDAHLGSNVAVTTYGGQPAAVTIASESDIKVISFAGAVAGAKKAGVGVSNTDIVNYDEILASVGAGSTVTAAGLNSGVKITADAKQDIANVSVSGAAALENAGVAGVLGVLVTMNKAEARVAGGATVKSAGDATIAASNDSTTVVIAGGVAGGKEVGVGGAIAVNAVWNRTHASIGSGAEVAAKKTVGVDAQARETAVNAVVAGAGGGKAGVAGALSINAIFADTAAFVDQGGKVNTDPAYATGEQKVRIAAQDDSVIVGIAGGGAGGGKAGVGAALDTTVLAKSVKAYIADDTVNDGQVATVKAVREVAVNAAATEVVTSVTAGFAGGGNAGVGGAVSLVISLNDIEAYVGKQGFVDADGNVLITAEDDITAVLVAGSGAGGGDAGVGGSLGVATLLGVTRAYVGESAQVNARGNRGDASVFTGDTVITQLPKDPPDPADLLHWLDKPTENARGLSVTAYNRENLFTTVVSGAGGGKAGVAATVGANVIAGKTEAYIGRSAKINETNTNADAAQQVRVKAIDETLLVDIAGAGAGGGQAGIGAAGNIAVIARTTEAWIGQSALVNASKAVALDATASAMTFTATAGFAGGGQAGVGGAVAGVAIADNTRAYVEDATAAMNGAQVAVSGGDLSVEAVGFATSWLLTGSGAGGGAAGVGGSLAVGVNASSTVARIGDHARTNATGTTSVTADSTENVSTITISGSGGGTAGVAGSVSFNVVVSNTEAGIGDHAEVNQDPAFATPAQEVEVRATDRIITVGAAGVGTGGGAAGVGGTADVTVVLNTTSAYIGDGARVSASKDVTVSASSEKYVNSVTIAGSGGGTTGIAGAASIISVGSLLDGEARSGLKATDDNGNETTRQSQADGQTTKSAVGDQLGTTSQAADATGTLDSNADKLEIGQFMSNVLPHFGTTAYIGSGAEVQAGGNVTVSATETTTALILAGAGTGGGAVSIAGTLGVVLVHDSAEAFIASGAQVDAGKKLTVAGETREIVVNLGITGSGAGAADIGGGLAVNVISSDTAAYIGAAEINQGALVSNEQSVAVTADSDSYLVTVAGSGGGAGAASVGGVLDVNTLVKRTKAYIGEGAAVAADTDVEVSADSSQILIGAAASIRGAGAAAVGVVAGANVVANTTEAFIGASRDDNSKTAATVDSGGNVKIAAVDDTLIIAVSAVGNGAGAAGVGFNVGANVISSQTRAYVSDSSTVNAWGNAAGTTVYNGTLDPGASAVRTLPPDVNGDIDLDRDGTPDGNVDGGASFSIKADSDGSGSGGADSTVNPSTAKDLDGNPIPGAGGGLGAKGQDTGVKGLSVVAMGNEKIITAGIGVAGAGAAAVTGAASINVISAITESYIGDHATINDPNVNANPGGDVRVRAADNTLMVLAGGTVSGAGAAAVSGTIDTGVVAKQTHARIGAAEVHAQNVEVSAAAREDLYEVTANVSVAGAAGVGAAASVGVVTNDTLASIGAGAGIDATGDIRVHALQGTSVNLFTFAGSGGVVGVAGAVSAGVIANTTRAYVAGAATPTGAAALDASGTTEIKAESEEDILTGTLAYAGGGVGVAGAVAVRVVASTTEAYIGDNTQVNQTRHGAAQDVKVSAADTVKLRGAGGGGAVGGFAGVGATAEVNIVRNTTTAYLGSSVQLHADRDVSIAAASTKDVQSAAIAAAGGGAVGIGGAVSVVTIGAKLDEDSQGGLSSEGTKGQTASFVDSRISDDQVSGQLGDSEHVQGTRSDIAARTGSLGVAAQMNETADSSLDKTRAYIGSGSRITAGRDVGVSATDRIKVDVNAAGAGGGAVGIGGAVGVAIANSTTESFIGSAAQIDAGGNVTVAASAGNVDPSGALVRSTAGAGGVVGLSATVAVMSDTSATRAYLGSGSEIQSAEMLTVEAYTDRTATAQAFGATAGALAIGASIARSEFAGATSAYFDTGVLVGKSSPKEVDDVLVQASDDSTAVALAVAGSAGILAGSGADAQATIGSAASAYLATDTSIVAQGGVTVAATATPKADARALGVNIGAGAVGASLATASSDATVNASVGSDTDIEAAAVTVTASRLVPTNADTAYARALGAAGGLLIGVNATVADALAGGQVTSTIGANTALTLTPAGTVTLSATNNTSQYADSTGLAVGFVAAGFNDSNAESDSLTHAVLGSNVRITGGTAGSVTISAAGTDRNLATAVSGSGGVIAGAAASANTSETSDTQASIGAMTCGAPSASCGITTGTLSLTAAHDSVYNSKVDSRQAAIAGASGSTAEHEVSSTVRTSVGSGVNVTAKAVTISADNQSHKNWWGQSTDINTVAVADGADWNINSGSGGLLNLPAGSSRSDISHVTQVSFGTGTTFHVLMPALGTGSFNVDAASTVVAYDKTKLDSGGAIALAESNSIINVYQNSVDVTLGTDTAIVSDSGDVNIGSRADARLDARAVANAYGLAGAPSGKAYVTYAGSTTTRVLDGTVILATDPAHGAINIGAGRDSGQQAGSIVANSHVNLWNKTAAPISTDPDARTLVTQNATVELDAGSNLLAAGDIGLAAARGAISVSAVGIGKDLYREALGAIAGAVGIDASFDITGGLAPAPGGTALVDVDGVVLSGLMRQSATQIDVEILNQSSDPNIVPTWRLTYAQMDSRSNPQLAANPLDPGEANPYVGWVAAPAVVESDIAPNSQLQARIDLLYTLKAQYASDPVASAAYDSEIRFLENKLGPQGIGQTSSAVTPRASAALDAAGAANAALSVEQAKITGDVNGQTTAAQIGAVGALINDYLAVAANNTGIDTALTGMKNKNLADATYVALGTNRSTAATRYTDLRNYTASIGNYGFSCTVGSAGCAAPQGPLGTLPSSVSDGTLIVSGAGYLGSIQNSMRNVSLLALKQSGATGTLTSNVSAISTQMNNVKIANQGIIGAVDDIHTNLSQAATKQASLSAAWRDTATSGNVDTARVATVTSLTGQNAPLIQHFDDSSGTTSAGIIATNAAIVSVAADDAAAAVATVSAASDTTVPGSQKLITLPDISVKLGNVNVTGDVLAGTGALQAPGDAMIWVVNNAPTSMNVANLTIDSSGGNVRLNGFLVNDDDDVRRFNPAYLGPVPTIVSRENGAAGAPQIRVVSNYDPSEYNASSPQAARRVPAAAPNITLGYRLTANEPTKQISNPNGSVVVTSAAGDIYVDGSITAGSVSILARNGDFVQQYVNGFNSVAGEPNSNVQGGPGVLPPGTNAAPGAGIVANGNIFLSARYLNINGLVQSGIVNYHLDIPTDANLRFVLPQNQWAGYISACGSVSCTINLSGGRSVTYEANWLGLDGSQGRVVANKAFIDQSVGQPVAVAVTENGARDFGAIAATYDPAAQKITMSSNVAVRGGSIVLFGQIINTASGAGAAGTGTLKVLDGFGQIAVNNQSSLPVELKSIDTGVDPDPANAGRGTVGTIDITDVQYVGGAGDQNLYAIHTVISRDQNAITVDQTGQWLANGQFCLTCTTTGYAADQNSASRTSVSGARSGAYNPQAGLRYVYTTGKKTSTEYTWTFKGQSFFGTSSLSLPPDNVSRTLTSGPNVLSNVNLPNGIYLSYLAPGGVTPHLNNLGKDAAVDPAVNGGVTVSSSTGYQALSKSYQTSSVYNKIAEWNDCNWWTLCISSRYTSIWTQTTGTTTITTNSVKADYPIQIEFMGSNTAGLNIVSPLAPVTLTGQSTLRNRYGDTSISTTALVAGAASLIDSRNVTLNATNGSLGAAGAPVNLFMSGVLNASAVNGNVVANQIAGALEVGAVSATGNPAADRGRVLLTAQGDIFGSGGSLISGARVELESVTGTIGGIAGKAGAHAPLNVAPGYTADLSQQHLYGLKAAAAGDIGIDVRTSAGNTAGHLLADTIVSAGGDVRVTAPGQILDNNPVQSIDTRVWSELLGFWDSVGLVAGSTENATKVGQAISVYESTRSQDYFDYWQIRTSQNAPTQFDAGWSYQASAAEASALTARGQDVAAFEANRTARYWALSEVVAGFEPVVYARSAAAASLRQQNPAWTREQISAQVLVLEQNGNLPGVPVPATYVEGFTYVASQAEREPYTSTGSWTTPQLALSINPGLLKDITDTNPVIKAPNVSGRNVTLVAGTSIGTTLPSSHPSAVFVPYSTDGNISDAAKIALATAEYSDFVFDVVHNGMTGLRVEQRLPFNFSATTALDASVRTGGLDTNGLTPHVNGTDIGNAYLASLGGGLIGNLSVDGELRFKVKGSITAVDPALVAIRAGDLILESASGSIGGDSGAVLPLRVEVMQGVALSADSFGSITARATGPINLSGAGTVNVGGLFSRDAIVLTSETGSILDAHPGTGLDLLGGTLRLLAPQGSIGDIAANEPISVGTIIGTRLAGLIEAAAGDSVYLNGPFGGPVASSFAIGPVVAGHAAISAGNAIRLTATNDAIINGDVIAVGPVQLAVGGVLTLSAARDIELTDTAIPPGTTTITAPAAHVRVTGVGVLIDAGTLLMQDGAKLTADTGTVAINTTGDAIITDIITGNPTASAVIINSGGRVLDGDNLLLGPDTLDITAASMGARVTINAVGQIGGNPLDILVGSLDATSDTGLVHIAAQGDVAVGTVQGAGEVLLTATGELTGNTVTSTGSHVVAASSGGGVDLGSVNGATGAAVAGQTDVVVGLLAGGAGNASASSTGGNVGVTTTTAGGSIDFAAGGSITAGGFTAGDSAALVAGGSVDVGTGTAGSTINVDARGGNGTFGTLSADRMTLAALHDLGAGTLNVGSYVELAGDNVQANVLGGSGIVGGSVTGYNGSVASSVQLVLSAPGGFAFDSFFTALGTVEIPQGSFSFANGIVVDRATFTNPQTSVLVDQHNRALQPFDIQIYTGGAPFAFGLESNHLFTDALSIQASPNHEVMSPTGPAVSAVVQSYRSLALADDPAPAEPEERPETEEELISYSGTPVALDP